MTESPSGWLSARRADMESLLERMVRVSSHTHDKPGVDAVGAILRECVPLACEPAPSERYGDALFWHSARRAGEAGVVLVGHHDTVFPKGSFEGYSVEGELARGPGVLDMKGGLTVMIYALKYLESQGILPTIPLTLAVVGDEEVGSPESSVHLRRQASGASCALVFESGRAGDAIITRRKGTGSVTALATGKAAHAGNNHRDGVNALWALARFIDKAQSLTDYDQGVTLNVGEVHGGIGKNTVPESARAEIDLRFVNRADGDTALASLREIAESTGIPGAKITLQGGLGRMPLERSEASLALMQEYARCALAEGLGGAEAGLIGGGSDASTTSELGVPSIDGLGPRGAGFHTRNEYTELSTLVPKAAALCRFLMARAMIGRS